MDPYLWQQGRARAAPGFVPGFRGNGETPVEREAPPSSYAVASFLDGEPGSGVRLAGLTAIRTLFIIPGLWLGGKLVPGVKLSGLQTIALSASVSSSVTAGMVAWYALRKRNTHAAADAQSTG